MKKRTFIAAVSLLMLCAICLCCFGCSIEEEQRLAGETPALAPATRAIERVEQRLDPIVRAAQPISVAIQKSANDGASLGIPGAGLVALIATGLGTLLGAYNERRTGTAPAKSALAQVVQSVEAAFPEKTAEQKAALAAVQDRSTREVVSGIKGD